MDQHLLSSTAWWPMPLGVLVCGLMSATVIVICLTGFSTTGVRTG